jgi:hypothetical protein
MKMLAMASMVLAATLATSAQGANSFRMTAMFSDQAGLVQYIQLQELSGFDGQHRFAGLTLRVTSRKGVVKTFTFGSDLPGSSTAGRPVLIGTTHVGLPDVDFMLPPGFLPIEGGTIVFAGVDSWTYEALSRDGYTVLVRGSGPMIATPALPICFRPSLGLRPVCSCPYPVIEYYNEELTTTHRASTRYRRARLVALPAGND